MKTTLVDHARRELTYIGEDDETIEAYLRVITVLADMSRDGSMARVAFPVVQDLLAFKNLTPLTDNPNEWEHLDEMTWHNKRNENAISNDGGKTYYFRSQIYKEKVMMTESTKSSDVLHVWEPQYLW